MASEKPLAVAELFCEFNQLFGGAGALGLQLKHQVDHDKEEIEVGLRRLFAPKVGDGLLVDPLHCVWRARDDMVSEHESVVRALEEYVLKPV
jgi:hypothetical protein